MKLIFLYGRPGVGKLTVGEELARLTGFRLFHNHLAVDLALSLFEFGSPAFVELRESVWLAAFEQAGQAGMAGIVFTFAPENTVRQEFISRLIALLESNGAAAIFVELTCCDQELERRMASASRAKFGKLTSLKKYRELDAAGVFSSPRLPPPALTVDTSKSSPAETAAAIAAFLNAPPK